MPGPKSDKLWADAVRVAVNDHVDGDLKKPKALRQLAANLVKMALEGDMAAVKEIGDRLDGKPATQADVTSNGETISFPSEIILRAADASGD